MRRKENRACGCVSVTSGDKKQRRPILPEKQKTRYAKTSLDKGNGIHYVLDKKEIGVGEEMGSRKYRSIAEELMMQNADVPLLD